MNTKERIIHAISFEAIALSILIPVTSILSGTKAGNLVVVGVGLSIFTVIWNYIFNIYFDKVCKTPRSNRTPKERVAHVCLFELGLIVFALPAISWFLAISIWEALILELGFLVFFFFYTMIFNYYYDKLISKKRTA
ncbi:PACE efflux transporter [Vibrio owensii]|uniref:PACE efflux transporter n=1 Tax=Vibrio owensii TaxID=696485 RepID=UPI003CC541A2